MLSDFITGVTTCAISPLPLFLAAIAGLVRCVERHVERALGSEVQR